MTDFLFTRAKRCLPLRLGSSSFSCVDSSVVRLELSITVTVCDDDDVWIVLGELCMDTMDDERLEGVEIDGY